MTNKDKMEVLALINRVHQEIQVEAVRSRSKDQDVAQLQDIESRSATITCQRISDAITLLETDKVSQAINLCPQLNEQTVT